MSQRRKRPGEDVAAGKFYRTKNREVAVLAVCLALLLCLSSCGTGHKCRVEGNVEVLQETAIRMTYDLLDGPREYEVQLSQPSEMRVEVLTRSGTLALEIGQEGQMPIYIGNFSENFSFTVFAEAGRYTITLSGKNHVGGYGLEWADVRL